MQRKGISFIFESTLTEDDLEGVCIIADKDKLNRVFANIFSNAVKFSSKNSKIITRVSRVLSEDAPGSAAGI